MVALLAALLVERWAQRSAGLDPASSAHAGMVAMGLFLQLQITAPVAIVGCFVLARLIAGHIDARRRATVDSLMLLWLYAAGQGLLGVLLVHGFPRVVA
jgi:cytochrome c oxidase subunit I+III